MGGDVRVGHVIRQVSDGFEKMGDLVEGKFCSHFMLVAHVGCQRGSLQIFHDDVGMTFMGVKVVDLDNVGMAQTSDGFGFALKAHEQVGVTFDVTVHHLNGDGTL